MGLVWADNAILFLLGIYSLGGLIRGFAQVAYTLVFWLVGIIVGWFFSQNFSVFLLKVFSSPALRLAGSFVALIVIALVMGWIIKLLLGESVKKSGLSFLDRIGGLTFGFVHGVVVVFVMVLIAGLTPLPAERWWHESKYIPPFQAAALMVKRSSASKMAVSINYPNNPAIDQ